MSEPESDLSQELREVKLLLQEERQRSSKLAKELESANQEISVLTKQLEGERFVFPPHPCLTDVQVL